MACTGSGEPCVCRSRACQHAASVHSSTSTVDRSRVGHDELGLRISCTQPTVILRALSTKRLARATAGAAGDIA